jgi:hypothetical protein
VNELHYAFEPPAAPRDRVQPLDAAVLTLVDVLRVAEREDNVSAAEALFRVRRIARAALERLGQRPASFSDATDLADAAHVGDTAGTLDALDEEPPF